MKKVRQANAKKALEAQLLAGVKVVKELGVHKAAPLTPEDIARIKAEILILNDRLGGKKKKKQRKVVAGVEQEKGDRWFIDIYSISFSRTKHSARRGKGKGASRKKSRTVKTKTFLKAVVCQSGSIQAYREGRMGLSPKSHSFSLRKEVTYEY